MYKSEYSINTFLLREAEIDYFYLNFFHKKKAVSFICSFIQKLCLSWDTQDSVFAWATMQLCLRLAMAFTDSDPDQHL